MDPGAHPRKFGKTDLSVSVGIHLLEQIFDFKLPGSPRPFGLFCDRRISGELAEADPPVAVAVDFLECRDQVRWDTGLACRLSQWEPALDLAAAKSDSEKLALLGEELFSRNFDLRIVSADEAP